MRQLSLILVLMTATISLAAPRKTYKIDLPVDDVINVQSTYEAFEPIIVGCACDPAPATDLRLFWSFSPKIKVKEGKNNEQHIWAPEGDHEIQLTVVSQQYTMLTVLVPDTTAPAGYKTQTIKIAGELSIQHYKKGFRVGKAPLLSVTVPNVVGKTVAEASTLLTNNNLVLVGATTGTVATQSPAPNAVIAAGSTVTVTTVPTPVGPKSILILYETDSVTESWTRMLNQLRKQIDQSPHQAFFLDKDSKGSDGKPSKVVVDATKLLPVGTTYPAVVIKQGTEVLFSGPLPDDIYALFKLYGISLQ